jgi:replication-associated recombination protein RarA
MSKDDVKNFIKEWKKGVALLLIGPAGSGKTYSIHEACKDIGYNILEIDAIDLNLTELRKVVLSKPLVDLIIVIDGIDGLPLTEQSKITKIINESYIPIILTSCSSVVAQELMKACKIVYYNKPKTGELLNIVNDISKKLNLKPNYEALKGDYRQAILSVYGSQGYEGEEKIMDILKKYFKELKIEEVNDRVLIGILDNSHNLYGIYTYLLVKALTIADIIKKPHPLILNDFKYHGTIFRSYFYEKLKMAYST